MKTLLSRIQNIEELNFVLENWCQDDGCEPEDFTERELITLVQQRREEFYESGHCLNEGLMGDHGKEEQDFCREQLRRINQLWAKINNK